MREDPTALPDPVPAVAPDTWTRRVRRAAGPVVIATRRLTARRRLLPDFVVIGAQKAGTTTLYSQLVSHPSVLPALRKEVHYFDTELRALDWYRAFFARMGRARDVARKTGAVHTGEATPFYLCHPAVPARVHAVLPHARLVAILRDPVERAISGYHHAVRMGDEMRPIEDALDPDQADPVGPLDDAAWWDEPACTARRRGYLVRGHYAEQLERWLTRFPREQLLVLDIAQLDDGAAREQALAFIGIDVACEERAIADRNVHDYERPANAVEERLRAYFAPHNARLWELLGEDWRWPS